MMAGVGAVGCGLSGREVAAARCGCDVPSTVAEGPQHMDRLGPGFVPTTL